MDDSKIITLFFERSQNAVNELSEKYGRLCLQISVNILKNISDSEECVNDAYLALWNNIPPEVPDDLKTYLIKVVRNISLKRYHANTAVKRNSFYDTALSELEEVLTADVSSENEVLFKELSEKINTFLGGLSRENRTFFVCRYYYGDSIKAIAEKTGNTPHLVSVRLMRTREKLKEYLRKEELI